MNIISFIIEKRFIEGLGETKIKFNKIKQKYGVSIYGKEREYKKDAEHLFSSAS